MGVYLGINVGHDAGVTLLDSEAVILSENEERYSRIKNHHGFPFLSLKNALNSIPIQAISRIGIEGKRILPRQVTPALETRTNSTISTFLDYISMYKILLQNDLGVNLTQNALFISQFNRRKEILDLLSQFGLQVPVHFFDHHDCHHASATLMQFAPTEIETGVSVSFDASGEGWCSKVYDYQRGTLNEIRELRIPSFFSPANLFLNVTKFLNFTPLRHEGKIMGLAAYGDASKTKRILSEVFGYNEKLGRWVNRIGYRERMQDWLRKNLSQYSREDIAAGMQELVEDSVCTFIEKEISIQNKSKNFFLSGGLFANVKLNQKIVESRWCNQIYVAPNMGDGGLNLGAALLARNVDLGTTATRLMSSGPFVGHYIHAEGAKSAAEKSNLSFKCITEEEKYIAEALANNLVIAIAREGMEYGPRALGNRSILYQATDKKVNSWLNEKLGRSEFMPFAPVLTYDAAQRIMELQSGVDYSHMTVTCRVKKEFHEKYPAITHVDGTARPQLVHSESFLFKVLSIYRSLTGLEVLVNTSFNMHEEPIVRTAFQAIKTFQASKIDLLFMPGIVIGELAN